MEREYWNRRYAAKEFIWTANANRFVAAEVANLLPGRALDLAAGEGRNAVWLAERGWSVRAVDFSDVAIERKRCIRQTDPNLKYREPGPGMPGYRGSREHRYGGDRFQ